MRLSNHRKGVLEQRLERCIPHIYVLASPNEVAMNCVTARQYRLGCVLDDVVCVAPGIMSFCFIGLAHARKLRSRLEGLMMPSAEPWMRSMGIEVWCNESTQEASENR